MQCNSHFGSSDRRLNVLQLKYSCSVALPSISSIMIITDTKRNQVLIRQELCEALLKYTIYILYGQLASAYKSVTCSIHFSLELFQNS